jgi:hypothetical protein
MDPFTNQKAARLCRHDRRNPSGLAACPHGGQVLLELILIVGVLTLLFFFTQKHAHTLTNYRQQDRFPEEKGINK